MLIAVEDDGPGVPSERRRIFYASTAAPPPASRGDVDGVGLGLALVSEHVVMHGGRVWVEDKSDGSPGGPLRGGAAVRAGRNDSRRVGRGGRVRGPRYRSAPADAAERAWPSASRSRWPRPGAGSTPTTTPDHPAGEAASDEPIETARPPRPRTYSTGPPPAGAGLLHADEDGETSLVRADRTVEAGDRDRLLNTLLEDPPGPAECKEGLITSIPETTQLSSPPERQDGGVLNISLNESIFEVEGDALRLAFGQLVCTATSLGTVQEVTFEVDGVAPPASTARERDEHPRHPAPPPAAHPRRSPGPARAGVR